MWGMGRIEYLCLQLIWTMRQMLLVGDSDEWTEEWAHIGETCGVAARDVFLDIVWCPHKMRLAGDIMQSSAAEANERCDILLVGWPLSRSSPILLGHAYHTTNVVKNTWSEAPGQVYPESRVLCGRHHPTSIRLQSRRGELWVRMCFPALCLNSGLWMS